MTPEAIVTPLTTGEIFFAHNPIVIIVRADETVVPEMPMYCDVYFKEKNDSDPDMFRFFKTITAFTYDNSGTSGHGLYRFDIHNVCVDYINTWMPVVDEGLRLVNSLQHSFNDSRYNVVSCICSFRGAHIDDTGVITLGGGVPVERTLTTDPVSGSMDLATDEMTIIKASVWDLHNKMGITHLNHFKPSVGFTGAILPQNNNAYVLSHYPFNQLSIDAGVGGTGNEIFDSNKARPYYFDGTGKPYMDYDQVSCYVDSFVHGDDYINAHIYVQMCDTTGQPIGTAVIDLFGTSDDTSSQRIYSKTLYYLPCSPASIIRRAYTGSDDIAAMFKDTSTYGYYYIRIADTNIVHSNNLVWTSQYYKIGGPVPYDHFRVMFQNRLGCFESLAFTRVTRTHKNSSNTFYSPLKELQSYSTVPMYPLYKQRYTDNTTGMRRVNIRGWDEWEAVVTLREFEMDWFRELMDSPMILALVKDPELALWRRDSNIAPVVNYLPVVIADSDIQVKKLEGTHQYEVSVKFKNAWEEVGVG